MALKAGSATRRRIEELRGEDCETVLRRMVARGLLEASRDDEMAHAPNLYRVTAKALGGLGYPTLEAFQEAIAGQLSGEELHKAQQLGGRGNGRRTMRPVASTVAPSIAATAPADGPGPLG